MSRETGIIKECHGKTATVMTQRKDACAGCSEREVCHTLGNIKDNEFIAINKIRAEPGDKVIIEFDTKRMLGLSALLYLFPAIALLAGGILGDVIGRSMGFDKSVTAVIFAFLFLFAAAGALIFLEKRARQSDAFKPVIIAKAKKRLPAKSCDNAQD